MKEQFCTFDIALKLKELGFDEKCFGYFKEGDITGNHELTYSVGIHNRVTQKFNSGTIAAPLWQQVVDWLLKDKKLLIVVKPFITKGQTLEFSSFVVETNRTINNWFPEHTIYKIFSSYEEARKQAILKALTLIKTN